MNKIKVTIASDHAGYAYKQKLIALLEDVTYEHVDITEIIDLGPADEQSVDYPDYAHEVATSIEQKGIDLGILICGSGNGVCMAANKHTNVRAALCWDAELASLARLHNDANVLCLPARFIDFEKATAIVNAFFETTFEGGRHERRVNKINI